MAGKSIRWFEWNDLGYKINGPIQMFTLDGTTMELKVFDGDEDRFVGQAQISLIEVIGSAKVMTDIPITADILIAEDGEKVGQIILWINYEITEVVENVTKEEKNITTTTTKNESKQTEDKEQEKEVACAPLLRRHMPSICPKQF